VCAGCAQHDAVVVWHGGVLRKIVSLDRYM
jgi:hypothetical protein